MDDKKRSDNYKIRQLNGYSLMNFIGFLLILILGALIIAYCIIGSPKCDGITTKQLDPPCNDYTPCTWNPDPWR